MSNSETKPAAANSVVLQEEQLDKVCGGEKPVSIAAPLDTDNDDVRLAGFPDYFA